ncbi:MAG: ABC transporter permease [Treponema sp.]|nr:ABC transporter permease [Treponema sp.]
MTLSDIRKKINFGNELMLVCVIVCEIVLFGFLNPRFLRPVVLCGSINDFISICIIALFETMVIIAGGMDIQAGSIVGLSSIVVGVVWQQCGLNIWAACVVAIIAGAICGLFSGFIIAYAKVQPMVVTLGGSFLYSGLAISITRLAKVELYKGIGGFPEVFTGFTKFRFFKVIPFQILLFLVLIAIAYVILHKTKYGRYIYMCGINPNAAEFSGINTKVVIMTTYALCGMGAALAGIVLTSYLGTAKADFGKELTLPIITAVVLGGTSITGGVGTIVGTALSALVIGIMRFGLSMAGLNTQYLDIPVGILLIIIVAFRALSGKERAGK